MSWRLFSAQPSRAVGPQGFLHQPYKVTSLALLVHLALPAPSDRLPSSPGFNHWYQLTTSFSICLTCHQPACRPPRRLARAVLVTCHPQALRLGTNRASFAPSPSPSPSPPQDPVPVPSARRPPPLCVCECPDIWTGIETAKSSGTLFKRLQAHTHLYSITSKKPVNPPPPPPPLTYCLLSCAVHSIMNV